ncbi:hypothetical protein [Streptomyces murinus]|uniref:hypothetical protein n=1 Tax=Streptomyces murinus TaxID=33900 RepID=UPI0018F677C6|nr:hypothetical protein [Streptomyces murinus]
MTPEQARAHAALILIHRLVRNHGLTAEEAVTAVAQRRRREDGPHTELVIAEAHAVVAEAAAPVMALMKKMAEAMQPMMQAASAAMAELARAFKPTTGKTAAARRDRPAWASPYGPRPHRR